MNEENLMKTYIYGAGNIALHIIAKMKEYEGEITGFIDSYKKGEYEGYPIVLLEDVEKDSNVVISVESLIFTGSMMQPKKI